MMRVLFAASEIFPYAKTGGLADVAHSLPQALNKYVNIARVMPFYSFMQKEKLKLYDNFTVTLDGGHYRVEVYVKKEKGVSTYFIKAPYLSARKHLYGDKRGDYKNNALRFGIFSMAIVELAIRLNIELIHLNDWHTALVALFVKDNALNIKTVFTIHNLAYQGIFEQNAFDVLGIDDKYFTMESLEFYGQLNFLKAGVAFSDAVTTVSPSYAKEILSEGYGCGLSGFLCAHKAKIAGILNGIDYEVFKPLKELKQKNEAKTGFCKKHEFKDASLPLFVMVSRLVEQKGIDLLIESFEALVAKNINIFILGEGDKKYLKVLTQLAKQYNNFYFFQGYDENLSHQTYLASDFLLMPSVFEPCGLNQFIAMNYASVPVVHEVGGLKDSVHEYKALCGRGIIYSSQNKKEFLYAVERALQLYSDRQKMDEVLEFNLACDFSFDKSAKKYFEIYESLS